MSQTAPTNQVSQIAELLTLAATARPLDLSRLVDAISAQMSAAAHKDIAEAKEILGEDADKYIPVSRDYYRFKREQMRLEHEQRMLDLEYQHRRAIVEMDARTARHVGDKVEAS